MPQVSGGTWKFSERPGGWIIAEKTLPSGQVERHRISFFEKRGKISLQSDGIVFQGELLSATQERSSHNSGDESWLTAQFPGKVRKLFVKSGDSVSDGDLMLLVEAMKMEFAIKAPYEGKVKKVLVQEGQQLAPGDPFLELEALADEL